MLRLWVLSAAIALIPCAAADAATVRAGAAGPCDGGGCIPARALLEAEPGERNDVTLTPEGVLRDDGAPLRAGEGCLQIDEHAVRCPPAVYVALLGDGDDRATGMIEAYGGPGDDTLFVRTVAHGGDGADTIQVTSYATGGPGDDRLSAPAGSAATLNGEEGDDLLSGTPGNDQLDGGPGHDTVEARDGMDIVYDADGEPGADRLDGGHGDDMLHLGRAGDAGMTVDLAAQRTSDDDAIAGFENAVTGAGDDLLIGDDGPNELNGGAGQDRLRGGAGPDHLEGDSGFDRFDGGDGADRIDARGIGWNFGGLTSGSIGLDAAPEPIVCGPGLDVIEHLERDHVAPDCEAIGEIGLVPFPRQARGGTEVAVRCPRRLRSRGRCRGVVRMGYYAGSQIERARFSVPARGGVALVRASYLHSSAVSISVRYEKHGSTWRWVVGPQS